MREQTWLEMFHILMIRGGVTDGGHGRDCVGGVRDRYQNRVSLLAYGLFMMLM